MTNRIMFALQKGGVGKTTSTVAVAEILAAAGYKVLVCDFDPQGNATKMLTQSSIYRYSGHTIMEAIQIGKAEPYIIPVREGFYDMRTAVLKNRLLGIDAHQVQNFRHDLQ